MLADDFNTYMVASWALTGTGTPTAALTPGAGGQILLTTTAGATDSAVFQKTPAAFSIAPGKPLFFKWQGKMASLLGSFYTGLADIGEGVESATVDGILISKAAGTGLLTLDIYVASVHVASVAFPSACLVQAATMVELGFAIDSLGNVLGFFNPTTGVNPINESVAAASAQPRGAVVVIPAPSLPATVMAPVTTYTNGSAAAETVNIDYIVVSRER
jgi:hypothetical protein